MENQDRIIPSVVVKQITFNDDNTYDFKPDDIVLLVGPNNVGKSRAIKDLRDDLNGISDSPQSKVIIKNVEYTTSNFFAETLQEYFERNIPPNEYGGYNVYINQYHTDTFPTDVFFNYTEEKQFYKVLFSFLSTENRLEITQPIKFNSFIDVHALNMMQKLEYSSESIYTLNKYLRKSFEKCIDTFEEYLNGGIIKKYKIGYAEEIVYAIKANKRVNTDKLKDMDDLYDQGDGIRSAVAILSSLIANEHSLFLIDEPETFLHPPQARMLGRDIVELSHDKQCFISTHSIDFIKGILESGSQRVKLIKIDRTRNINMFNIIDGDVISQIANDKNLKYTNILDGLFYSQLVLCEDESDCKFYSAVLEHLDSKTYQSTLFCAVGGKHQFKKIVPLLNGLQINYIIVADIDLIDDIIFLKQLMNSIESNCYDKIQFQHKEFIEKYRAKVNPQLKTQAKLKSDINALLTYSDYMTESVARQIKDLLKAPNAFALLKKDGIHSLPEGECSSLFYEIKNFLNSHKTFILECGEIEQLVSNVDGHGISWVEKTYEKYPDIGGSVYDEARRFIKSVFRLS